MDMTRLDDLIWEEFERLHQSVGWNEDEKAWSIWEENLRRLGIEKILVPEEEPTRHMSSAHLAIKKILEIHRKNPEHVISYAGEAREKPTTHHVYLVPKKLAVLGGMPVREG